MDTNESWTISVTEAVCFTVSLGFHLAKAWPMAAAIIAHGTYSYLTRR